MHFIEKFVIPVILIAAITSASLSNEYSNTAFLDEAETYNLYWKINDAKQEISFAVEVKTLGWVGFGISSGKGNMVGADVVIGWVKDNKGYLKDRYADSKSLPSIDEKQDYNLTAAYEENGKTVLKFTRKYDTCDKRDRKLEDGTTRVIYAYHTDDPESDTDMSKHTVRGSRSLILLNILTKKPTLPNDLKHFDLRVNASLSNKDTTYYCKPFKLPTFNGTKKHVVKISPVISPGHEGLVHHILVYGCKDDFPESNLTTEGDCYQPNMPGEIHACIAQSTVAAWAIGGGDFYFPDHVGYPIGDDLSIKFVLMEVHYDNPAKKSGITDKSGLRFHYTSMHRQYDADVLWVGWAVTRRQWIPPGEKKWDSIGYCPSNCTRIGLKDSTLPEGGVKLFASILHSHLLGSALWTRHIRNGKELPMITRDEHYDFNFQEYQIFKKERHLLPGDEIIQHCQYDSSARTKLAWGGLSTREEMCLSYMYYYPRVNFTKCVSWDNARNEFITQHYKEKNFTSSDYMKAEWTDEWKADLKRAYEDQKYVNIHCEKQKGIGLEPVHREWLPKPVVTEPLKQVDICPKPPTESASTKVSGCVTLLMAALIQSVLMLSC